VPARAVLGTSAAMRSSKARGRGRGALSAFTPAHAGGGSKADESGAPGL